MSGERLGIAPSDLARSPAAARVGALAASDGLFLSHFEHRVAAPTSEEAPTWSDGVLVEDKYAVFRHEIRIGSFHPGHRAKWGAHELCHGLVGFAAAPGVSPLFVATAARLAELVPVVLWYFLDEVGLRRCPRHVGPLFRTHCVDCEAAAARGAVPVQPDRARVLLADAARFLDGELAAIARTLRSGRPCPHVWGSLDLCSDGLAYAAAHGERMRGEAFALWHERFFAAGAGGLQQLDELQERAVAVARAIAQGAELSPLVTDPEHGRQRWIAQDLGARLLEVWELTEGACARALLALVDRLAEGADAAQVATDYRQLAEEHVLPDPSVLLAVGYELGPSVPEARGVEQVEEGLASVVPLTMELFEDAALDPVPAFLATDAPAREPLGLRFARWMDTHHPGPAAELAGYEAALRRAAGEPEAVVLGATGEGWRLPSGAVVLASQHDPVRIAEAASSGETEGRAVEGRLEIDDPSPRATTLVIARDGAGELVVADVEAEPGPDGLDVSNLSDDTCAGLVELGLLVPCRWSVG
ncbi:MAG: hypothetical protein KTR31_05455 [Myxococcales bacterium]|nr:hypothetical protein [Myxococcales bacterium]